MRLPEKQNSAAASPGCSGEAPGNLLRLHVQGTEPLSWGTLFTAAHFTDSDKTVHRKPAETASISPAEAKVSAVPILLYPTRRSNRFFLRQFRLLPGKRAPRPQKSSPLPGSGELFGCLAELSSAFCPFQRQKGAVTEMFSGRFFENSAGSPYSHSTVAGGLPVQS